MLLNDSTMKRAVEILSHSRSRAMTLNVFLGWADWRQNFDDSSASSPPTPLPTNKDL